MLLATWNVNGLRARSQRLAEWLAERKPDVACLQELKLVEDEFPHLELRASGYEAVLAGQQGWNGVAVIARTKPELVTRELPGGAEAVFELPRHRVRVTEELVREVDGIFGRRVARCRVA